ncbi:hypothetical protein F4781DRAFT_431194 [Annulohypoxylon bovei var. microspora]|nr:hypothetical protein F4781DRAFT_431194 [Annulohypoxylon bovei var. microspora]
MSSPDSTMATTGPFPPDDAVERETSAELRLDLGRLADIGVILNEVPRRQNYVRTIQLNVVLPRPGFAIAPIKTVDEWKRSGRPCLVQLTARARRSRARLVLWTGEYCHGGRHGEEQADRKTRLWGGPARWWRGYRRLRMCPSTGGMPVTTLRYGAPARRSTRYEAKPDELSQSLSVISQRPWNLDLYEVVFTDEIFLQHNLASEMALLAHWEWLEIFSLHYPPVTLSGEWLFYHDPSVRRRSCPPAPIPHRGARGPRDTPVQKL